jgi:hypothetical protein
VAQPAAPRPNLRVVGRREVGEDELPVFIVEES